ncbi:hypothetical protein OAA60_00840 [Porticoccaceae bacterium]|nr:hypothetical protein [Porticoccaceae bacterium]
MAVKMTHKYAQRTNEYHKRLRDKGLKRINLYVPAWAIDQLKEYADKLRRSAGIPYKTVEQERVEYLESELNKAKAEINRIMGR